MAEGTTVGGGWSPFFNKAPSLVLLDVFRVGSFRQGVRYTERVTGKN